MPQFVYILINPSLSGLLKIGRTNRLPEQRAQELSAGTNMPTPFVVAYEEMVPNGSTAEKIIHDLLSERGYRVSDGREFFSAPLKDAIRIMAGVAQKLRDNDLSVNGIRNVDDEYESHIDTSLFYLQKGIDALHGSDTTLQDFNDARIFLERAADLGNVRAYWWLAHLYMMGNGVRQSAEMALKLLKLGGDKGDPECYLAMWKIYSGQTVLEASNEKNAALCFKWYLDVTKDAVESQVLSDYLEHTYKKLQATSPDSPGLKNLSIFPDPTFIDILKTLIGRGAAGYNKMRDARLKGIERSEMTTEFDDIFHMSYFLMHCATRGDELMRSALVGLEEADLRFCYSGARDLDSVLAQFLPFLTRPSSTMLVTQKKAVERLMSKFISRFVKLFGDIVKSGLGRP